MAIKYVSIHEVLDRIMIDPLFESINDEFAIIKAVDLVRLLGIPNSFEEKVYHVEYDNYRAQLPNDFLSVISVLVDQKPIRSSTDVVTDYTKFETTDNTNIDTNAIQRPAETCYKINNTFIYLSKESGNLSLIYSSIPVDDNGYPLIPDDTAYIRALQKYIELEWGRVLWRSGKITDKVFQDMQQQYAWAAGAAETSMRRLSVAEMESLVNMWCTLIPRRSEFSSRFRNNGAKEIMRRK